MSLTRDNKLYIEGDDQYKKNTDKLLNILNWVTQVFVIGAQGDVVSADLTKAPKRKRTLIIYLSHNNPTVSPEKKLATMQFKTLTAQIISDMASCAVANPVKKEFEMLRWRDEILKHLTSTVWVRITRRIEMIKQCFPKKKGKEDADLEELNSIIDKWAEKRAVNPNNASPDWIQEERKHIFKGKMEKVVKTKDIIKKWILDLVRMFENMQRTVDSQKDNTFHRALCRASCLISSPFMTDMEDERRRTLLNLSNKQESLIDKLHRRIWKLFRYITGAEAYILIGIPFFKELFSETETNLTVDFKWILNEGLNPTKKSLVYVVTETEQEYEAWQTSMVEKAQNDEKIKNNIDASLLEHLKSTCKQLGLAKIHSNNKLITFNNTIHCEVNLILFSLTNGIEPEFSAIGVSKLMCWTCTHFVKLFEDITGRYWNISGTSGRYHFQWLLPVADLFNPPSAPGLVIGRPPNPLIGQVATANKSLTEKVEEELLTILKASIQPETGFTRGHIRSRSDSSTGSSFTITANGPNETPHRPYFSPGIVLMINS